MGIVAAKLAFFPPKPTYKLFTNDDGKLMYCGSEYRNVHVHLIDTKSGNKIVAVYWRCPSAKLTVLYSHGNACDLGQMTDPIDNVRSNLHVNVMSYDYSGYGHSTGKPSEINTYHDIEAVYNVLVKEYGLKQEDLILYGNSIGSGPTLHLASRLPRLGGVVLHSAFLSGMRVLFNVQTTFWFDIYKNIKKIRLVNCLVLVIHGDSDATVDFSHGKRLYELARRKYEPLWIKGGGHNDLVMFPAYYKHLREFIKDMEQQSRKRPSNQQMNDQIITENKKFRCFMFGKR